MSPRTVLALLLGWSLVIGCSTDDDDSASDDDDAVLDDDDSASDDDDSASDDDDSASDDDDDDDTGPAADADPAPVGGTSDGECPDLSSPGTKTFSSGGLERTAIVLFPRSAPAAMPVLFVWHGLGFSASNTVSSMGLANWVEREQAIAVVPSSTGDFLFEWDYAGDGAEDLALFDDLRSCLVNQLGADVRRFASTGFSAGGLWTTSLAMKRSTSLATVAPLSGGLAVDLPYTRPEYAFPAVVVSGAEGVDTWGAGALFQDFSQTSDAFAQSLAADGHVVVRCNHGGAHQPPSYTDTILSDWVLAHRFGYPSPFADGVLGALPGADCSLLD